MKAVLYSAKKPSVEINKSLKLFKWKYGEVELEWQESDLKSGFKLLVGDDVYYWDANSKFEQLKTEWQNIETTTTSFHFFKTHWIVGHQVPSLMK